MLTKIKCLLSYNLKSIITLKDEFQNTVINETKFIRDQSLLIKNINSGRIYRNLIQYTDFQLIDELTNSFAL